MSEKKWVWLAWALGAVVMTMAALEEVLSQISTPGRALPARLNDFTFFLFQLISVLIAVMIISRQRRNTIGWLLMAYPLALAITSPLDIYMRQAATPNRPITPLLWTAAWLSMWSWWLLIGPVLLIPLLFPNGRLPGPRWRWAVISLGLAFLYFLGMSTFTNVFQLDAPPVRIANPIGFLDESMQNLLLVPFEFWLFGSAAVCVAAVFARYRRAGAVEREQIKWLVYACGVFLVVYSLGFLPNQWTGDLTGILFNLAVTGIPLAIGAAVLRYHLWEIDILVRRTLGYTLLTLTLAIIYFGSVILLQRVLGRLVGEDSQVVILLSTLLIAALFTPLRRRFQGWIDRRFYRRKYDAERVLAEYAALARNETDLGRLTGELAHTIQDTVQPESVSIWLSR